MSEHMLTQISWVGHHLRMPSVLSAAALAVDHLDDLVLRSVQEVHLGVSGRVGKVLRLEPSVPWQAHDGIAGLVYGSIGLGFRGAARALRAADAVGLGGDLEATPSGRFAVAAVNGLIGSDLREQHPDLSFAAAARVGGRDVTLTREGVAASYPTAGDSLVVFLHGLCENEDYWQRRRRPRSEEAEPGSYGDRLAGLGWSPVTVRYNTGVPVAEVGVEVHALLRRLVDLWPVPVRRIALVGHSMGGLVARAALAVDTPEPSWPALTTDLVTLGTPHLGSPVERMIERGMRVVGELPELAPYRRIFARRSAGVRDLHDGLPDDRLDLPDLRHHLVAATLTRSPRHLVARSMGDLLVPPRSALAISVRGQALFPGADRLHVPAADHFDLLNHDAVYAAIARWLGAPADRRPSHAPAGARVPQVVR